MNTIEQRIAIAEACGFIEIEEQFTGLWGWVPWKTAKQKRWTHVYWKKDTDICLCRVPDYLNDLNAMHEAEKRLSKDQFEHYYFKELMCKMTASEAITATAAQRAEAFLRTLNLWKSE